MTESNVAARLTRNLRFKLTYIQIFEDWLDADHGAEMSEHLRDLVRVQQSAVAALSSYLRRLDMAMYMGVQDLELNEKLLGQAVDRRNLASRLRFVHEALLGAVSWYRLQFADKQMTSEPELYQLLLELGELDAVKLWRTKAIMGELKIPLKPKEKDWDVDRPRRDHDQLEGWRPRLLDDLGQSAWSGDRTSGRPGSRRSRRKGSRR